jgi:hypothetical protein
MIIIFPMLSPSTSRMLLQTKSAGSESFVVSLQARNQFSKPSTEMKLIQWPRAAISTTCEQDQCVCDFAYLVMKIWPHCNLVLMYQWWLYSVCVILHIASWWYGRIVTLFWCINDDYNLCVWFCISRDMLLWLSLCSTIFCMIYLLTCKAWRTRRRGLAKSNSNSLANQLVSLRIPDVS